MTDDEIKELAKEIVGRFAAQWEDTLETQLVERDGAHILVMQSEAVPYMSLHFNLEKKCEDVISRVREWDEEEGVEEDELPSSPNNRLPMELRQIATTAPKLLVDFHLLLNLITLQESAKVWFGPLSRNIEARITDMAEDVAHTILRRYNLKREAKKPGRLNVIKEDDFLDAVFRLNTTNPSKRQLAKELNTTPATVRSWLRSCGFTSPEALIDDLFKRLEVEDGADLEASSN